MKKFLLSIMLLTSGLSYSQSNEYNGYLEELYIARQPSPRAEAMGRGHVADNQNDFGSYYNAALTSLSEGLNINTSFSNKYSYSKDAFFNYFGASYKLNKIGSIGLSRYRFDYNQELEITTPQQPSGTGEHYRIYFDLFTLNYSREIIKDLYAGLNVNLADNHNTNLEYFYNVDKSILPTFDFGILKKFRFPDFSDKTASHSVNFGLSLVNFTSSKYVFTSIDFTTTAYLPVILRLGGSYNLIQRGNNLKKNGEEFSFLLHVEFEKILNSAKHETYKLGGEFSIYDILLLRMGYVSRNTDITYSVFSYHLGKFTQFTYGAGVKIPLDLIFKMKTPLTIKVDYVNLNQASRRNGLNTETPYPKFNSLAVSLNWVPNL